MDNEYPYRGRNKFQIPNSQGQVVNPYDEDSRLFQDLQQRGYIPAYIQTINLGTAGELLLSIPGFHFVVYGHDNSANKAVDTTVLVNVYINSRTEQPQNPYPAKHGRGFSGPFANLFLKWPAQTNMSASRYCDFIIYKNADKPWIDGETPT